MEARADAGELEVVGGIAEDGVAEEISGLGVHSNIVRVVPEITQRTLRLRRATEERQKNLFVLPPWL